MSAKIWLLIWNSTLQTLSMVFFSTLFSLILGLPLGVLLFITGEEEQGGIIPMPLLNSVLSRIVNVLRSFPFIILMILLFPLSRLLIGTSIGTAATIVPLSIAAAPFVARHRDRAQGGGSGRRSSRPCNGIDKLPDRPEGVDSRGDALLVSGVALTIISLIGYSAMAGAIGGGGLGDLAIRYGYQRFRGDIMLVAVIIILVLVEIVQVVGNRLSARLLARR